MAGDPSFSSNSLLLLGNGTNGSTSITDSSNFGHTISLNGDVQISTSSPKFGTGALLFDGTGDYLTTAAHATAFQFGTGAFTIDFWIKYTTTNIFNAIGTDETFSNSSAWNFQFNGGLAGRLQVLGNDGAGGGNNVYLVTPNLHDGVWHHIALARTSGLMNLWIDGVAQGQITNTQSWGTASTGIIVGTQRSQLTRVLDGRLDCVRITKGVVRWDPSIISSFTPPTTEDDYLPVTANPRAALMFYKRIRGAA